MAMATYLQMVSEVDLAKLRAQPTWINELDRPDEQSYSTYFWCTINYFLAGDAWPMGSKQQPLGGLLFGFSSVTCPTLEHGHFGVLDPGDAELVLRALGMIDLADIRRRIADADPDELAEEEVDDFELLVEDAEEDPGDVIASEVEGLVEFYKHAVRHRYGVVSYTT
jgi:hypothetical protein